MQSHKERKFENDEGEGKEGKEGRKQERNDVLEFSAN